MGASHFRKYTSSAICQYLPQGEMHLNNCTIITVIHAS
ncbi:hypothetical protein CKA32_001495 [Geitlerinema sp. FC II]|nr:hypothetical protein CKA32_001495 [Geitlerinema sp. FC II]